MEPQLKRQRWIASVAAVLTVLMLFYYVGSWWVVGFLVAAGGALVVFQASRNRNRGNAAAAYCLNCGESLNRNARQCGSCGSIRWTVREQ